MKKTIITILVVLILGVALYFFYTKVFKPWVHGIRGEESTEENLTE